MIARFFVWLVIALISGPAIAQDQYDLVIINGRVIDPKNNIDGPMDVAIRDGKIARIGKGIDASQSKKTVDAAGLIVTPGFIDIHTHVFVGSKPEVFADGILSLSPDDFTFRSGVTTVVDAGTSGWRNFATFKTQVIDKSKTRILTFLNISGVGMVGDPAQQEIREMNVDEAVKMVNANRDQIVGIKIGHYEGTDWKPFDHAIAAGKKAEVPVLVECHLPEYSLEDQLRRMRPGDIITHSFEKVSERVAIVDDHGKGA